ncbi:hypothetical protein [Kitasatospora sp. NPDC101183]
MFPLVAGVAVLLAVGAVAEDARHVDSVRAAEVVLDDTHWN